MTNYIRSVAEVSIVAGKLDEFKKIATEAIERVEANEPDTLSYEWFFNDDESKCYLLEWYKNSEAVLAHLENIGDLLGSLVEISSTNRLEIYGDPSEALRQTLEPFGAKIHTHWHGITR